jgi:hypothetical protein
MLVEVTVGIDSQSCFYASLYNAGDSDIYLTKVVLNAQTPSGEEVSFSLLYATKLPVADGRGSAEYVCCGTTEHNLISRRVVRYYLGRSSKDIEKFLACPHDHAYLSVWDSRSEIHRVGVEEILPTLAEAATRQKAIEEEAATRQKAIEEEAEQQRMQDDKDRFFPPS